MMLDRQIIFVLGSGRSGSSAFTRVLSLCGCDLPPRLFGGDDANPRGFWEPTDAAWLNLNFLLQHDGSNADPSVRIQGKIDCEDTEKEEFIEQIRAFLVGCPVGSALIIKEPLINGLVDYWFNAARRERFLVKVLILIRHPHEVAASSDAFGARIGWDPGLMMLQWLRVNLITERNTRDTRRVFVEHANVMSNWREEVRRVSTQLDVDMKVDEIAVDRFLTRDLYRQRHSQLTANVFTTSFADRVYAILTAAAEDQPLDVAELDEIYHAYCRSPEALEELQRDSGLFALRDYFQRRPVWRVGRDF